MRKRFYFVGIVYRTLSVYHVCYLVQGKTHVRNIILVNMSPTHVLIFITFYKKNFISPKSTESLGKARTHVISQPFAVYGTSLYKLLRLCSGE